MRLLGKDISGEKLVRKLEARLRARGLLEKQPVDARVDDGIEPRVDPYTFNLAGLERHADPTVPLPLHTHRTGAGRLVLVAKWAFRKAAKVFINETLARQRLFNGHVRDAYAQLSAEVVNLRAEVDRLKARGTRTPNSRPTHRR